MREGRADYGMAPVENSLAGGIHAVWDLLAEQSPPVVGELYFHVKHFLIGHPGSRVEQIRQAASHIQALAQCAAYLQSLGIETVEEYDTAGAVALVKARGNAQEAAIAPAAAAQLYDMEILAENIQTDARNYTRFLIISHGQEALPPGDQPLKTTLIADLSDCASQLAPMLNALGDCELSKVETRKLHDKPWAYRCYIECMGTVENDELQRFSAHADRLCQLAPYPTCTQP